jgi:hypothetical protein
VAEVTFGAYAWPAAPDAGLSNAVTFGDNSVQRTVAFDYTTTVGVTYLFSAYVIMDDLSAPVIGLNTSTGDFSIRLNSGTIAHAIYGSTHIGSNVYRVYAAITSTVTSPSHGIRKYTGQSAKGFKVSGFQLEALPSGNVIGSDLMDQEALTARTAGYTLVVGTVYKIVSQATLDFTTVGASANTAGTYFICHTASALGAGDAASDVTSPAKGSFHDVAMLAGSTELVTNNLEAAGAGPPAFLNWTDTIGGTDTLARSTTAGEFYLGSAGLKATYVDNGTTYSDFSFTTTAGKLYKAEFYTRGDATVAGRYQIYNNTGSADIVAVTATGVTSATFTKVTKYFYTPTGCVSTSIRLYVPASAGFACYDYVSVRQVQTTWTRYSTNTMEIDSTDGSGGALKMSYVDNTSGAQIALSNARDMSSDLTVGETYQVSFKAKVPAGNSVDVGIYTSSTVASVTITETSLTSKTLYYKCANATNDILFTYNLAAGESIWIDDLTIKAVPDLAYLSPGTYTPTAGSTATIPAEPRFEANGLLVEGEATNLITYSQDITASQCWSTPINITATGGQTDLFGGATAIRYVASNSTHNARSVAIPVNASTSYTWSFWAKNNGGSAAKLSVYNATAGSDITAVTSYFSSLNSSTFTRITNSFTTPSGCTSIYVYFLRDSGSADINIIVAHPQLEATAYPTSYIPTNGCPVTRTTEAGSATNGYSWTMSTALIAAATDAGTMLVDYTPGHAAAGGTGTGSGIVSLTNSATSFLYYDYTNTNFEGTDGTNSPDNDETIVSGTTYTVASRWDQDANSGDGYFKISEKHSGTWTHGTATNFNDAYAAGTALRLGYTNEYPFWIKNIKFFDGWVKDANLDAPTKSGLFPIIPTFRKVKPYEY